MKENVELQQLSEFSHSAIECAVNAGHKTSDFIDWSIKAATILIELTKIGTDIEKLVCQKAIAMCNSLNFKFAEDQHK